MGIDSIGGNGRAFVDEGIPVSDRGTLPSYAGAAPRAGEQNSTSSWQGTVGKVANYYGSAVNAAKLISNATGNTSPEVAKTFDFLALLGQIFEQAAEFFRGDNASKPVSSAAPDGGAKGQTPTPTKAPQQQTTDPASKEAPVDDDKSHENETADSETFASNAKAQMNAGCPAHGKNAKTTRTGISEGVETEGTSTSGGATLKGKANARAFAEASATTSSFAGPDGVGTVATAEAHIGVEAGASGSITSDYGNVSGSVHASAELYARAKAYTFANTKGARAGVEVEVGARAEVDAQMDASTLGGNVSVHGEGMAEAGTSAKAQAKVGISYDPLEAAVNAKVGAFAGARAGASAKGGACGINYGASVEVRAGVGIDAQINAGLEDGKLKFSWSFGISVGVGFGFKLDFEIDFKGIGKAIGDLFGAIAGLFGGNKGDGSKAGEIITQVVGSIPQVQDGLTQVSNSLNQQFDKTSTTEKTEESGDSGEGEIDLQPKKTPVKKPSNPMISDLSSDVPSESSNA